MRIASICMQAKGGAGLSSHKLHKQFLADGHESRLFVAKPTWNTDGVELIPTKPKNKQNWWTLGTVPIQNGIQAIVTSGYSGKCEKYLDSVYEWADVILLRWVTGTVSDYQIARWAAGPKPIIWCLSDMAPLTGGCHYSNGCYGYESSCEGCTIVKDEYQHVPVLTLKRRESLWKDEITIVSPSRWLKDCASNSTVLRDMDVRVIRTGVELDVFRPIDKSLCVPKFDLDPGKFTILFGAESIHDNRKGFQLLLKALEILLAKECNKSRLQILVVGICEIELSHLGVDVHRTGNLLDRNDLCAAYSAADVTVLPYKEDNLPNVMIESIGAGTPVVAFDVGGMPDVILNGVNGYLALPYDCFDLATCIEKVMAQPISRAAIREWAEANLDIKEQSKQYINLFEEVLTKKQMHVSNLCEA